MHARLSIAVLVLSSWAAAQTPALFSPAAAATGLGNSNNSIPFSWSPIAYQQIHDANTFSSQAPLAISQMRLRMASGFTNSPGRTVDLELFMHESPNDAATCVATFASNVSLGTEVNVFARKMVNLPMVPNNDWAVAPFPFDQKFAYPGGKHIGWRCNVYGNSNGNAIFTYPLDAFQPAPTSTLVGTGCASATGTAAASHTVSGLLINATTTFTGNSFVVAGGLPALLAIGISNTTFGAIPLPFSLASAGAPGCSIYNDWAVVLVGVTLANANGSVAILVPVPNDPSLIGSTHYSQYLFFQAAANPLGIFTSNGRANKIVGQLGITRIFGTPPAGPSGSIGRNFGMAIGLN